MVQKRPAEEGAADAGGTGVDVQVDAAIAAVLPQAKKQRPMDVLNEGSDEEGSADEDEYDMLNWRAKTV
jgi:hypothetical protein